jgi:hypothetical protein
MRRGTRTERGRPGTQSHEPRGASREPSAEGLATSAENFERRMLNRKEGLSTARKLWWTALAWYGI